MALLEEEQCEDLLLFVELLHCHTMIMEEVGDVAIPDSNVQVTDVISTGVCLLLSFVNEELLKVYYYILLYGFMKYGMYR